MGKKFEENKNRNQFPFQQNFSIFEHTFVLENRSLNWICFGKRRHFRKNQPLNWIDLKIFLVLKSIRKSTEPNLCFSIRRYDKFHLWCQLRIGIWYYFFCVHLDEIDPGSAYWHWWINWNWWLQSTKTPKWCNVTSAVCISLQNL